MEKNLVKATEYGLTPENGTKIENEFAVVTTEQNGLVSIYNNILKAEINKETEEEARQLSTKLSKLNSTNNKIHKSQKAFYLAGGKFVDALKNKNRDIIAEMQDRLEEIKNYSKNLRIEEVAKLKAERLNILLQYDSEIEPMGLGEMQIEVWDAYLVGIKAAYDAKIEAEKKAEEQRIADAKAEEAERERIRLENIKLKEEAIEREKLAKIEEAKRAKAEKARLAKEEAEKTIITKRQSEMQGYIVFIRDYNKVISLPEKEYRKEMDDIIRGAREQWEYEREEKIKKQAKEEALEKERNDLAKKLALKEAAAAKEVQRLAQIEIDRVAKSNADKLAESQRLESELNKGDAAKVKDLINDLVALKTKFSFKSKKNQQKYADTCILIDKVINHINK